eukprot:TRINITY_DN12188_c1_g1_i3.p2 TRINITY_DN12188_c1_g1~~TRINITY_DN12188_c1_g1_i3.p2  ORF type:complete len:194 (+),score=-6.50 TRINITY_DN12188_c1_g1_i3:612-1193(+)
MFKRKISQKLLVLNVTLVKKIIRKKNSNISYFSEKWYQSQTVQPPHQIFQQQNIVVYFQTVSTQNFKSQRSYQQQKQKNKLIKKIYNIVEGNDIQQNSIILCNQLVSSILIINQQKLLSMQNFNSQCNTYIKQPLNTFMHQCKICKSTRQSSNQYLKYALKLNQQVEVHHSLNQTVNAKSSTAKFKPSNSKVI